MALRILTVQCETEDSMEASLAATNANDSELAGADLGSMAEPVEPVSAATHCGEVYDRFRESAELIAIPVVEDGRPIGLVNRHDLLMNLAHDFGRALYAHKPIGLKMDAHPLIVDRSLQIDALEWLIAKEKPSALMRGFIVTCERKYSGVATALSLLQLNLARTEARNRQLDEARRSAEAANRAKSHFLATMSHELRTPLNAIIGFSDLMQLQVLGPIQPPKYREYAEDINVSAQNLLAVINDVLDMAKIEDGKMVLFDEAVDVEAQITAALRFIAARAAQNHITLIRDIPPGLPPLYADRRAIRHMLLNLLSNAVKFTPAGGKITVVASWDSSGYELAVIDTGIGMAPEHIEIALSPFGQVANEYTRSHDGSGLGLPLVKSFAELHGAKLEIESALGSGTAIRIIFPPDRIPPFVAGEVPRILAAAG